MKAALSICLALLSFAGSVKGQTTRDALRFIEIKLQDEAYIGNEKVSSIYWSDEGACTLLKIKTKDGQNTPSKVFIVSLKDLTQVIKVHDSKLTLLCTDQAKEFWRFDFNQPGYDKNKEEEPQLNGSCGIQPNGVKYDFVNSLTFRLSDPSLAERVKKAFIMAIKEAGGFERENTF